MECGKPTGRKIRLRNAKIVCCNAERVRLSRRNDRRDCGRRNWDPPFVACTVQLLLCFSDLCCVIVYTRVSLVVKGLVKKEPSTQVWWHWQQMAAIATFAANHYNNLKNSYLPLAAKLLFEHVRTLNRSGSVRYQFQLWTRKLAPKHRENYKYQAGKHGKQCGVSPLESLYSELICPFSSKFCTSTSVAGNYWTAL